MTADAWEPEKGPPVQSAGAVRDQPLGGELKF